MSGNLGSDPEPDFTEVSATKGGQKYLFVNDIDGVFPEILKQLKINNLYLSHITGEQLTEEDLE